MDAITYLLDRKEKSPSRYGLLALGACVVVWLNVHALTLMETHFKWLVDTQPFTFLFYLVVFLSGLAAFIVGCAVFALPLYNGSGAANVLRSWEENRILDEFTSTGLTQRYIVDRLLFYYSKRWAIMAGPSVLFGILLTGLWRQPEIWAAAFLYALFSLGAIALCVCCTSCYLSFQKQAVLAGLVPTILIGLPAYLQFQLLPFQADGTLIVVGLTGLSVYALVVSRYLAIFALERKLELGNWFFSLGQRFALKRRGGSPTTENPIAAREEMVGKKWGSVLYLAGLIVALGIAMIPAVETDSAYPFFTVILVSGFIAAGRAATSLSQSLTRELESSTLELLRTTPMGSERFLNGWLKVVVAPLATEVLMISLAALPLSVIAGGVEVLTGGQFLHCVVVALAGPFLGALLGASMAGQCKPRQEVAKQLHTALGIMIVCVAPQMMILLAEDNNWGYIVMNLGIFWVMRWLLTAGARKSLNRVFLPQK